MSRLRWVRVAVGLGALLVASTAAGFGCGSSSSHAERETDAGPPPVIRAGAGFAEIAPTSDGLPRARMFWTFLPADVDAYKKPLVLLFNGGPGFPTTTGLLAYGTAPFALSSLSTSDASAAAPSDADADAENGDGSPDAAVVAAFASVDTVSPNAASWTTFANLLYVDSRQAGFSYELTEADGSGRPGSDAPFLSQVDDARDFIATLLAFYAVHPELEASPVVIAGESYGGTRAQYILDAFLNSATSKTPDASLRVGIQAHFDRTLGTNGQPPSPQDAAKQFGTQVLIEPYILPDPPPTGPYPATCPADILDGSDWPAELDARVEAALGAHALAAELLGVPYEAIDDFGAAGRTRGFRNGLDRRDFGLTMTLGALAAGDAYFENQSGYVYEGFVDVTAPSSDAAMAPVALFTQNLPYVRTFITHALCDQILSTAGLRDALVTDLSATVDTRARAGVARPGWIDVPLTSGAIEIRYPTYDHAPHEVASRQAADLRDDVAAWLATP